MKEKLKNILDMLTRFVDSDWFIALHAVLILLGWSLNVWIPMLSVMAAIDILPLFFKRQTKHVMILLSMFLFVISKDRNELMTSTSSISLIAIVAVLIVGMVFNLIFFRRSLMPLHPKNIKGFHASLAALIFAFAFAGLGSPYEIPLLTPLLILLVALIVFAYSFFVVTLSRDENKAELPEYMLKILFASGVVIAIEMTIFYARIGNVNDIVEAIVRKRVHLGWAGPNNMAPILSMTIPATLYFCLKKNYATPLFTVIALIEYVLILFSGCRGAILFSTLSLPAVMLYVAQKTENRKSYPITIVVMFAIAVVLVAYYGEIFAEIINGFLSKGLDPTRRDEIYRLAIDVFRTWPAFGAGWDYKTDIYFHSTFFQIIATMGVFGFILFAILYFWRYKTFLKMRKDPACLALLVGMLAFEGYGMIDTNYFLPNCFILLMLMTFVAEVNVPEGTCLAFGGKDPVAHVVGFFRILADNVKPAKPAEPHEAEGSEEIKEGSDADGEQTGTPLNAEKSPETEDEQAVDENSPMDEAQTADKTQPADEVQPAVETKSETQSADDKQAEEDSAPPAVE